MEYACRPRLHTEAEVPPPSPEVVPNCHRFSEVSGQPIVLFDASSIPSEDRVATHA